LALARDQMFFRECCLDLIIGHSTDHVLSAPASDGFPAHVTPTGEINHERIAQWLSSFARRLQTHASTPLDCVEAGLASRTGAQI
jgi:hypothetical protein